MTESGQRLLPEGWVDYSAKLTPLSADEYGYGAASGPSAATPPPPAQRIAAGFPADSFMAIGSQGQYTIVIPSHDLVIVKIGWAYTPHDDHVAVERLVRETIAALQTEVMMRRNVIINHQTIIPHPNSVIIYRQIEITQINTHNT